jgi:peroxiredoxin
MQNITLGQRIPDMALGQFAYGEIRKIELLPLFARKKIVVIGVPGAFTPVCTKQHIPDFIAQADRLRAGGIDELICVAPNDPYTLTAWTRQLDPENKLLFLSDGNLDFTRAMGLQANNRDLFLGERSRRYLMVVQDCVVSHIKMESILTDYCCTTPADAEPASAGRTHLVS